MGTRNSRVRIRNETNDSIRIVLVKYNIHGDAIKLFNRKLHDNEFLRVNSIKHGSYTLKVFEIAGRSYIYLIVEYSIPLKVIILYIKI